MENVINSYNSILYLTIMRQHEKGAFCITSVCREDLKGYFTDEEIATVTDDEMEYIADKMADAYLDMGFWESLSTAAEHVLKDTKKS